MLSWSRKGVCTLLDRKRGNRNWASSSWNRWKSLLIGGDIFAPLAADHELDRAVGETELSPYDILQVTLIGEVEVIRIVAKEKEGRRDILGLGGVGDLESSAVEIRRLIVHLGLQDGRVEK